MDLINTFSSWIDLPSFLFLISAVSTTVWVTRGTQRIHFLEGVRRVALPIGILGSFVGAIKILMDMSDPSALVPAVRVMMLTTWYGLILHLVSSLLLRNVDKKQLQGVVHPSSGGMVLLGILWGGWFLSQLGLSGIDFSSAVIFGLGLPLLTLVRQNPKSPFMYTLAGNSVIISISATIYSAMVLYQRMDDPSTVGPLVAIMFCSFLYGGVIFSVGALVVPHTVRKSLSGWHYAYAATGIVTLLGTFSLIGSFFS